MTKMLADVVFDNGLLYLKNNCSVMTLCATAPTNYTEALTTNALADIAIDDTDITVGDGDTSGRKAAIGAQADVDVDSNGTGDHVAIVDTPNTALLLVTECTSQAVSAGNKVNFPTFDLEFPDVS